MSSFNKKLNGKALMAKLHRDEVSALYNSYPKDYSVCREAVPMGGSKYAYEVESCLPLPMQTKSREAKIQTSFNIKGVATARAVERAQKRAEALAEAPMEWNICGKVQYTCIRQYGMDGKSCNVQVKGEVEHEKLAKKAQLKIKSTSRCIKLDAHGRRLIEEEMDAADVVDSGLGDVDNGFVLSDVMSDAEIVDRALEEGAVEDAAIEAGAAS